MDRNERNQLIETYSRKPYALTEHLRKFPREMWSFKPEADHWNIREILWHVLDVEIHGYLRMRVAVATPDQKVLAFDQNVWSQKLNYGGMDIDDAIEGLIWVIKANAKYLKARPGEDFSKGVIHPEKGVLSLEDLLAGHNRHIEHHMDQMTKRFTEWKRGKEAS